MALPKTEKRPYKSLARERQAGDTRRRIVEATRQLLHRRGYAGMTIEAIARRESPLVGIPESECLSYFRDNLQDVVDQARASAEVTHLHPEGAAGAIAIAVAAAARASSSFFPCKIVVPFV